MLQISLVKQIEQVVTKFGGGVSVFIKIKSKINKLPKA
jgi:hypothetical protein